MQKKLCMTSEVWRYVDLFLLKSSIMGICREFSAQLLFEHKNMEDVQQTRQVFRELLQLLSSKEEQQQYQVAVPIADVPAELLCQWFDDHYHPKTDWFQGAFTSEERDILKEFNDFYDARTSKLPDTLLELLEDPVWSEIVAKAKQTLKSIQW